MFRRRRAPRELTMGSGGGPGLAQLSLSRASPDLRLTILGASA